MIHLCLLKFGKELKGRSTIDCVNELVKPLDNNITLHCYTDDHRGIDGRFNVYELSEEDKAKHIHWNMMKFFDPTFIGAKRTDQTIYMDIDVTWNKEELIPHMINHSVGRNQIIGIDRHWKIDETSDDCNLHDSFLKFNSHDFKYIGHWYFSEPEYYQRHYYESKKVSVPRYGVQNFIWESVNKVADRDIKFLPPNYVMKSHKEKYSIYADQYSKKTGRDYYADFDDAILHYLT